MRFLMWLVVFAGLLYGGYIAYDRWFDGDESLARKMPEDVFAYLKDKTANEISVLKDEYVDRPVREATEAKKEELADSAKDLAASAVYQMGDSLKSLSESITDGGGAHSNSRESSDSVKSLERFFSRIVVEVDKSLEVKLTGYKDLMVHVVEWGDGTRDVVTLYNGESVEVSHTYKSVGEYDIRVRVSKGEESADSVMGVSVVSK